MRSPGVCPLRLKPRCVRTACSRKGDWEVLCAGQPPRYFAQEDEADAWAEQRLRERTEKSLRAQGATGELSFTCSRSDMAADILLGGVKLCTRIRVTASTCLLQTATQENRHV